MRSQRELQLDECLVRVILISITGEPVLAANLRKLARPVGQDHGASLIIQMGVERAIRSIGARSYEPAPCELVIARNIEAKRAL